MLLFQIQKNLFTKAVSKVAASLTKTQNPADPSQYIVMKADQGQSSISLTVVNQGVVTRTVIDAAGDLLKIKADGVFVIQGDVLNEILSRTTISEMVNVDFEKSTGNEVIKNPDPNEQPLALSGHLNFSWNNAVTDKEEWLVPCIDSASLNIPTNAKIDVTADGRMFVNAAEFGRYVRQVGIAVGKDSGDASYRNVLIRTDGQILELVSAMITQLAWATTPNVRRASGKFSMTIPYVELMLACSMLDPESDVEIIYNNTTPPTAVFAQDLVYSDRAVGKTQLRLTCSMDKFVNFEKTIKALDFRNSCKVKTQQFRPITSRLDIVRPARTTLTVDASKNSMTFAKQEAGRVFAKGLGIPISDGEGDPLKLEVSSRNLLLAANAAEGDDIEIKFSGEASLYCMILSENMKCYFAPFTGN